MKPLEEMGKFQTVVVDPPWDIKFGGGTPKEMSQRREGVLRKDEFFTGISAPSYSAMSIEEIIALPMPAVLEDDAFVFLWTTQGYLPKSFAILEAWGLRYWSTMTWHKSNGVAPLNRPQYNSEFIVLGVMGKPQFLTNQQFWTCNNWLAPKVHSVKPEGFYDLLRRVTPAPRLDVFGRRRIAGFQSWGNEAPEGEALPDHYQQVLIG